MVFIAGYRLIFVAQPQDVQRPIRTLAYPSLKQLLTHLFFDRFAGDHESRALYLVVSIDRD